MWRVYIAIQIYPLTPPCGSNWGHKIADFVFLPYISFVIGFYSFRMYSQVLGHSMPTVYIASQIYYLTPFMGQTGVIK